MMQNLPDLIWADEPLPLLHRPTLIVMLTGWIDAGLGAAGAMEAIVEESAARPLAVFADDPYIDFRARRPIMEVRNGLNTTLSWEHITISAGRDLAGHDLLLLHGPEPDMCWNRFRDSISTIATELKVERMVGLGAYPFTSPHTRPCRLSVTTPSADVLAAVPFLRSSVDVPAGMTGVLELALHERNIPALSIWAQVPHYVAATPYPAASVALLDALREHTDVVVDGSDLRKAAVAESERLEQLVAANEDHRRMLQQLEQLHDASPESWEGDLRGSVPGGGAVGPGLEMRSGEEIAAELERFLRDQ
jgi:proteasome assembly chaperone (PAC2) family protein